jgi:N-acetylglucosaminyl-diphospho-decaprenol L-rhamnosyltransferase
LTDTGNVYTSVREFPSFINAAGPALHAQFKVDNPFTKRFNPVAPEGDAVTAAGLGLGVLLHGAPQGVGGTGWFRRGLLLYLGNSDLCWRAHQARWGVGFAATAAATHVQGVSTARHPYRMMAEHHRSALRLNVRTTTCWRRLPLPFAVLVLGVRIAIATARLTFTR